MMTSLFTKFLPPSSQCLRVIGFPRGAGMFQFESWKDQNRRVTNCSCTPATDPIASPLRVNHIRPMSVRTKLEDEPLKASKLGQKIINFRLSLGLLPRDNSYYLRRSVLLYESIDDVDKNEFFRAYPLEDTFFSWFRIAELHLWMLMVRGRAEGEEGIFINKCIMDYMWDDMLRRGTALAKGTTSAIVSQGLQYFHQELMAAFVGYDEGLHSDMLLAGALWNRFFLKNCNDPESVERLVEYVRRQIQHLDNITRDDFLGRAKVTWLPFKERR